MREAHSRASDGDKAAKPLFEQSILVPIEFSKQILPGRIEDVINYIVEKNLNLRELESK